MGEGYSTIAQGTLSSQPSSLSLFLFYPPLWELLLLLLLPLLLLLLLLLLAAVVTALALAPALVLALALALALVPRSVKKNDLSRFYTS